MALHRRLAAAVATIPFCAIAARADCPASGTETATIAGVESRLELRLADGRRLRLAGLDPALATPTDPDRADSARQQFASEVVGHAVAFVPLATTPDRWGRIPAHVVPASPAAPPGGGLAGQAIVEGLGRYLAEPAAHECRAELLRAEDEARRAGRGLWADAYYGVLTVDDGSAFVERAGTNVVAEGRLAAVQPGHFRTILRFAAPRPGSFGGHLLSAAILPHTMKTFAKQHVDVAGLIGRRLRLRGLLDLRFGPRIELAGPDDFEVLDAPAAAPAGAP